MTFELLIIYQLKHFIADYPLQGRYMLGKFKPGWDFLGPLLAHVGVHGVMTFAIALFIKPEFALPLALFDMVIHFFMDRIKASPKYLGRFKNFSGSEYKYLVSHGYTPIDNSDVVGMDSDKIITFRCMPATPELMQTVFRDNKLFWWALGLDQMVHHLTHYAIIYWLVT